MYKEKFPCIIKDCINNDEIGSFNFCCLKYPALILDKEIKKVICSDYKKEVEENG